MVSMTTEPSPSPCPGGCTEGAMCPACFARHELEAYARSLRQWLVSERLGQRSAALAPANDVVRVQARILPCAWLVSLGA